MDTGAALGGISLFISVAGIIYTAINHKHIRSNCCGREIELSIDIDSTEVKKPAEDTPIKTHNSRVAPKIVTE